MKFKFSFFLLISFSIFIISCGKDEVTSPTDSGTNNLFIRLQEGPGNDTVYRFTYDSTKRLKTVEDSLWGLTMTATYSNSGYISSIEHVHNGNISENYTYTYNSSNQLIQIDYTDSGITPTRIEITYTNGMPSKRTLTYSSNGAYKLSRTWVYTVKDSNITDIKEYNANNSLEYETSYTFTSNENILKPLALFTDNLGGGLGLIDAALLDTYFNKNLIATTTKYGVVTNYTYNYNDNKQLTKFVVSTTESIYAGIYTRILGY
jgi:hypothetical protein